ncbi:MAG: outer membrane lipoprotein carrier protein LolA [Bacteroidales bacterium]|nr:outer membrane lipoprotein carrier protein LolA [Bacteroidales bacterium]
MKRLTTLLLFIIVALGSLQAQISHTANGDVDKKADEILKRAASKLNQPVMFDVAATVTNADKQTTATAKASVLYSKGKYRMTMPEQVLYCDGTATYHWQVEAKELVVSPMEQDGINLMNPGSIVTNYAKNFRPKYIRTEPDGTAIVDLQPRQAASYHKVRLFVVEKTGLLKRMEVHRYDSSREEFVVTNFKTTRATDSDFRFDAKAHPEVEVIDMR